MVNGNMDRIKYLTHKAQQGMITENEKNELAYLLGRDPNEFQGPDGLSILIGIALAALLIGILIAMLTRK